MTFKISSLIENDAEEQARLASAPEGSKSHFLAGLQVRVPHLDHGMVIELPNQWAAEQPERRIVVVLNELRRSSHNENLPQGEKFRRNNSWHVIVVASTDERYPVSGYDLSIGEEKLRRGSLLSAEHILTGGCGRTQDRTLGGVGSSA